MAKNAPIRKPKREGKKQETKSFRAKSWKKKRIATKRHKKARKALPNIIDPLHIVSVKLGEAGPVK
jgi:hypothetical protein